MRPGARLAAAIDVLDLIDADARPADMILRDYFRQRRFAGSGDRRAVGALVFGALRRRGMLDWRLGEAGVAPDNRLRILLDRELSADTSDISGAHAPDAPSADESAALATALSLDEAAAPLSAQLNYPDWLTPHFREAFGADWVSRTRAALSGRAAVDLRVNRVKAGRDQVLQTLKAEGVAAAALELAPCAIRLAEPVRLTEHPLYRDGVIEIQDAGSQYVAALAAARPGERVADICAGAGGKTLALAADLTGEGVIMASDRDAKRLGRLTRRAERAGLANVRTRPVAPDEDWPEDWLGSFDLVLVDAPCTGAGTWRRQPEQRWRLTPARLAEFGEIQAALLNRAGHLVRPGGRLVYVTCSPFAQENEIVIANFLAGEKACEQGFDLIPWAEAAENAGLLGPSGNVAAGDSGGDFVRLSPDEHGVDGFFAAVMKRRIG